MTLDPRLQRLIQKLSHGWQPPLHWLPRFVIRLIRNYVAKIFMSFSAPSPQVAEITDKMIAGPENTQLPIRIYKPEKKPTELPILLYFHGGGWAFGNLDTADDTCKRLCKTAGCIVVSVDYRLAPEHPFPAALNDCYVALQWVYDHAQKLGGSLNKIAVGGDSAGGNLAAAVALKARDDFGPKLCLQLLFYPVTDATMASSSYEQYGQGYLITRKQIKTLLDYYTPQLEGKTQTYASPLHADNHHNLPTTLIIVAECDPLADDGRRYAQKLQEASVPTTLSVYTGMMHGFIVMSTYVPEKVDQAITEAAQALKQACDT